MTDLFLELRKQGVTIFPNYEEIYEKSRFEVQQIIYALIDCLLKVPVNHDRVGKERGNITTWLGLPESNNVRQDWVKTKGFAAVSGMTTNSHCDFIHKPCFAYGLKTHKLHLS